MKRILIAALLPVALSGAGCGSFYAEADQPQACLQLVSPQAFVVVPPAPGGDGKLSASVDIVLKNALPDFLLNGSPDTNVVSFLGLTLTVVGPQGSDTRWLKNLKITATNPSLPAVTLVDYTPTTAPTGGTFSVGPRDPNNNLVEMLRNGGLTVSVDASYDPLSPPASGSWTAGVNACFSAKVKKTFQQMVNGG